MSVHAASSQTDDPQLTAWVDDRAWLRRLNRDLARAETNQTLGQRVITDALVERAREVGCEAFALTGSTARDRRTAISDLDYHVVGPRPPFEDLPDDVDIYSTDARRFWEKLRSGDDFVQWTLRFGCVLFDDSGIFRDGLRVISTEQIWPAPASKLGRLPDHVRHAERLIQAGDRDAAQDQVRAALTSGARALLLHAGVFPLSRSEVPEQLMVIEQDRLADALRGVIFGCPSLVELRGSIRELDGVAEMVRSRLGSDRD